MPTLKSIKMRKVNMVNWMSTIQLIKLSDIMLNYTFPISMRLGKYK